MPNLRVIVLNNHSGGIFRLIDGPARQPELEEFFETVRKECVRHALVNASQLASEEGYLAEHIHQLRVALRRLRTALKLFSRVHNFEVQTWSDQAKFLAAQLGKNRDIDAMSESIWPELRKINAPLVEFTALEGMQSPALIVREGKIQSWFLELIGRDLQSPEQNTQSHWSATASHKNETLTIVAV